LTEALGWAHGRGLSVDDDLSYLSEFEHVTLARVLIARHKSDRAERSIHEAVGLLERLLKAAEEGGRTGSVIEIRVLQGLAHEAQGDISAALMPLQQALTLAEPEGYVRVFVDEGAPMAELLTRMNASRESIYSQIACRLWKAKRCSSLRLRSGQAFIPQPSALVGNSLTNYRSKGAPKL